MLLLSSSALRLFNLGESSMRTEPIGTECVKQRFAKGYRFIVLRRGLIFSIFIPLLKF